MTNKEREQVQEILSFLKEKSDIDSFEVTDNSIKVCTHEHDKKEIDFLKFRIMSAIVIINEKFDDNVDIDVKPC